MRPLTCATLATNLCINQHVSYFSNMWRANHGIVDVMPDVSLHDRDESGRPTLELLVGDRRLVVTASEAVELASKVQEFLAQDRSSVDGTYSGDAVSGALSPDAPLGRRYIYLLNKQYGIATRRLAAMLDMNYRRLMGIYQGSSTVSERDLQAVAEIFDIVRMVDTQGELFAQSEVGRSLISDLTSRHYKSS